MNFSKYTNYYQHHQWKSKYLYSKNAKNDEECAANDDDVSDWPERGEQSLYNELKPRCPTDYPVMEWK